MMLNRDILTAKLMEFLGSYGRDYKDHPHGLGIFIGLYGKDEEFRKAIDTVVSMTAIKHSSTSIKEDTLDAG